MVSLAEILVAYFSTPQGLVAAMVEFLLGLGAGYFLSKGLKYVIAFFVLLLTGDLLNVWAINELNLKSLTDATNVTALETQLKPLLSFTQLLYPIFVNLIVLVGFLIGAAIALLK